MQKPRTGGALRGVLVSLLRGKLPKADDRPRPGFPGCPLTLTVHQGSDLAPVVRLDLAVGESDHTGLFVHLYSGHGANVIQRHPFLRVGVVDVEFQLERAFFDRHVATWLSKDNTKKPQVLKGFTFISNFIEKSIS